MSLKKFCTFLFLKIVMLVCCCSTQPIDSNQSSLASTTEAPFTSTTPYDEDLIEELSCISTGDKFGPVNLYTDEKLIKAQRNNKLDDDDYESRTERRKLMVNKYYGVLRDIFFVKNMEGLITVQLGAEDASSSATILGLEEDWKFEYELAKIIIFYSQSSQHGSQHAILGETYALEVQHVHYRKDLKSLADAANVKHGILVLCTLLKSTGKRNAHLDPLVTAAISNAFPTADFHSVHGPLDVKAIFPADMSNLQYTGVYPSLPCAEEAKYVVFISHREISEKQLIKLREVRDNEGEPTSGVFGELNKGESEKTGTEVTVSKNVKLQVMMNMKVLSAGSWTKALFFFTFYFICIDFLM